MPDFYRWQWVLIGLLLAYLSGVFAWYLSNQPVFGWMAGIATLSLAVVVAGWLRSKPAEPVVRFDIWEGRMLRAHVANRTGQLIVPLGLARLVGDGSLRLAGGPSSSNAIGVGHRRTYYWKIGDVKAAIGDRTEVFVELNTQAGDTIREPVPLATLAAIRASTEAPGRRRSY